MLLRYFSASLFTTATGVQQHQHSNKLYRRAYRKNWREKEEPTWLRFIRGSSRRGADGVINLGHAYEKSSSYTAYASSSYLCILSILSPYFSFNWALTFSSISFVCGHKERQIASNAYICSFFFRIWSNWGDFSWYCLNFNIYSRILLNSRVASTYLKQIIQRQG